MLRLMLNDEFWSKLKEIMLQHGIYDKPNLRMVVEAMLYRSGLAALGATYQQNLDAGTQSIKKFNRW